MKERVIATVVNIEPAESKNGRRFLKIAFEREGHFWTDNLVIDYQPAMWRWYQFLRSLHPTIKVTWDSVTELKVDSSSLIGKKTRLVLNEGDVVRVHHYEKPYTKRGDR